jgi:hypothetical protein
MFERKEEDWKSTLNEDAQQILAGILETTKKHKGAYMQADDVKVAQLWCALVEMKKEIDGIKNTLGKVEEPFRAIISVGEAEKKRTIERIITEIVRPTSEETQEATKRLVESLMKF